MTEPSSTVLPVNALRRVTRLLRSRTLRVLAVASIAGALVACGGSSEPDIVVETSTPTPTPTATPTPTPTPTPEPWPIAAEPIPLGERAAPDLVNPASVGLPPPPQVIRNAQPNDGGLVRMFSPALGMDNVIETVHVVDGVMEEPEDGSYAVGWYAPDDRWDFGTPGVEGNLIFSAHETWNHQQGPFYRVHQARIGDDIFLEMADGEVRRYQVHRVSRYLTEEMPMAEVLWPSDRPEAEEWLTLYTCGGDIIYGDRGYGDYLARDVLVAKWVGNVDPQEVPPSQMTQQAVTAETAGD